ncbi:MAG: carbon-nitrogen hydrolase family protein, partial [Halobacteria archaeon]|nr:carbon-nitrogen hydrolase family protein [Halobacteria archaeon]
TMGSRIAQLPDYVDIALFPEYSLTGFVEDEHVYDVALTREDAVSEVRELAVENDVSVLFGFVEKSGREYYNAVCYLTAENFHIYRKRHLWGAEKELLSAGNERVIVDTPIGSTGILTCYDLNFVEESAAFTREKVDALLVVGAWYREYVENWRLLLRARALDGVRWVVGCGRVGESDKREYAGESCVVLPDGSVKSKLSRAEETLVEELSRETLERQRELVGIF